MGSTPGEEKGAHIMTKNHTKHLRLNEGGNVSQH